MTRLQDLQGVTNALLLRKSPDLENQPPPCIHQREATPGSRNENRVPFQFLGPDDQLKPPLDIYLLEHLVKLGPRAPPHRGIVRIFASSVGAFSL